MWPATYTFPEPSTAMPWPPANGLVRSPAASMISVIVWLGCPGFSILNALSLRWPGTYTFPAASTATNQGPWRELPSPSPVESMIAVTAPSGATRKTLLLPFPATKAFCEPSTAMPRLPPSGLPDPSPAEFRISSTKYWA